MAHTVGHLPEFDFKSSRWEIFSARLKNYFIANSISEDSIKRAILLNSFNEDSYKLMFDLSSPSKPESKSYEELIALFDQQFKPTNALFAARYKFYNSRKKESESIVEWMARLRSLATHCEFDAAQLNWVLRDIFVCGLDPGPLRDRLFEEDATKLDITKMLKLAQNKESTRHHMEAIESSSGSRFVVKSEPVHRLAAGSSRQQHQQQRPQASDATKGTTQQRVPGPFRGGPAAACKACGRRHHVSECRYKDAKCFLCKAQGHIATVCKKRSPNNVQNKRHNFLNETEDIQFFPIFNKNSSNPIKINLIVEGHDIHFEIDTGTALSVISFELYKEKFAHIQIKKCNQILSDYVGNKIKPVGLVSLKITYEGRSHVLDAFVIENGGPPLIGRTWLQELNLGITKLNVKDCTKLNHISDRNNCIESLCNKFPEIFANKLGTFNKSKVNLQVKDNVLPKYFNPRPLPFKLKSKVSDEIDRLINEGILVPAEYSAWGTPIVPVWKSDGSIRICGDFKITLNPALQVYKYPLPRIEELFAQLQGGVEFSKIDLSHAFNQLELDESSQELCTISTHKGLFRYTRLPYGIVSAPALFQKTMESVLAGIEGVVCFIDDILVTASTREKHLEKLTEVFNRLKNCGLTIKREKCSFLQKSINYLGHNISEKGLEACKEKVNVIQNIKEPQNLTQLRSFLGMVNYFGKFLPNLAATLNPLYKLTCKSQKFIWNKDCDSAFKTVKKMLLSSPILVHYNPELPLKLTVDASSKGLGAILSHSFPNSADKPIEYISRVLSKSEQNFSQIDKEALAIIWAVRKFHKYLFGSEFTLVTDHKPLVSIFGSNKGIPQMAASRLQRWAYILSAYNYKIQYIDSKKNIADYLSRCEYKNKINNSNAENFVGEDYAYINYISENIPLNFKQIKLATARDRVLSKVLNYMMRGWPNSKIKDFDKDIQPFAQRSNELSVINGCILWGYKIVIPEKFRNHILNELHISHLGVVKMKALARSYVWWPGINSEIEEISANCNSCNKYKSAAPKCNLHPWAWPKEPWTRLHIDYLGPFLGQNFFVLVDAHSKWIECVAVKNVNSYSTIEILREMFARFGLPKQIVSDNATVFISQEFQEFLARNGIQHLTGSPYHPMSNGAAENAVKQIKNCILSSVGRDKSRDLNMIISRFLFDYRNTVHSTTNESPAKLLLGHKLRNRFDLLLPQTSNFVDNKQSKQIRNYGGKTTQNLNITIGSKVLVRDYKIPNKPTWCQAVVIKKLGSCLFLVKTESGQTWKRHIDQIRSTYINRAKYYNSSENVTVDKVDVNNESITTNENVNNELNDDDDANNPEPESITPNANSNIVEERPRRIIKPPERYQAQF